METETIRGLLEGVRAGRRTVAAALEELALLPVVELGSARLDSHRSLRCGFGEAVFGQGKGVAELLAILRRARPHAGALLATRLTPEQFRAVRRAFPGARLNERARTVILGRLPRPASAQRVAVVTAGTSDLGVAGEALETLAACGANGKLYNDVGVAGLHRLVKVLPDLRRARVIIAVAGMEGALPSVIGGLVAAPVVAVPTSVGYGAGGGGLAALLSMLNSCSAGVAVVNIDNGFGAAMAAWRILQGAPVRNGGAGAESGRGGGE